MGNSQPHLSEDLGVVSTISVPCSQSSSFLIQSLLGEAGSFLPQTCVSQTTDSWYHSRDLGEGGLNETGFISLSRKSRSFPSSLFFWCGPSWSRVVLKLHQLHPQSRR